MAPALLESSAHPADIGLVNLPEACFDDSGSRNEDDIRGYCLARSVSSKNLPQPPLRPVSTGGTPHASARDHPKPEWAALVEQEIAHEETTGDTPSFRVDFVKIRLPPQSLQAAGLLARVV